MYQESTSPHLEQPQTADDIATRVNQLGLRLAEEANPFDNGIQHSTVHKIRLPRGQEAFAVNETVQASRAFKSCGLYGAVYFAMQDAQESGRPIDEFHIASAGNAALAAAQEVQKYGKKLVAHVPSAVSSFKLSALENEGAEVLPDYATVDEAIVGAHTLGSREGNYELHAFDRVENLSSIAVTIGQKILELARAVRIYSNAKVTVVLPLGGGSISAGVAIRLQQAGLENTELVTAQVEETVDGNLLTKERLPYCDGTAAKTGNLTGIILNDTRFRQGAVKVRTDQVAGSMLRLPALLNIDHDIEPAGALAHAGVLEHARNEQRPDTIYIFAVTGANVSQETVEKAAALGMRGCGLGPL